MPKLVAQCSPFDAPNQLRPQPPPHCRWAVVNQNGTLARGKGATAAAYAYPGVLGAYRVVFDKNVSKCLYLATLGTEYPSTPASGEIAVAPDVADVRAVHVVTRNGAGVATNRPFHLLVGC